MKILFFSDIHFHHTHRFSHITPDGMTIREQEHLSCADTIIDLCNKHNIDKIVFGGDLYGPVGDNISCQTQYVVCKFFEKLQTLKLPIEVIVGNHDMLSDTVNNREAHKISPFKHWENINVYDIPCIDSNNKLIYMPYSLCDEYSEAFLNKIENKEEYIIFSHLEIKDINLGNGIFTKKGVNIDLLKSFNLVFQGHYHSGGKLASNIYVSGSTQRLSFKDKGISKNNILIYDTETNKILRESFNCPDWLIFDDDNIEDILNVNIDNYVKLELTTDILLTDTMKEKLDRMKGKDIHIDVERISIDSNKLTETVLENEIDILKQFIEKSDNTDCIKEKLIEEGIRLYNKVN